MSFKEFGRLVALRHDYLVLGSRSLRPENSYLNPAVEPRSLLTIMGSVNYRTRLAFMSTVSETSLMAVRKIFH